MRSGSKFSEAAANATECIGLDAELLEHRDEHLRELRVVTRVAGDVVAVPVTATRQQDGQVRRVVAASVAEAAADEHLCGVEQAAA